MSEIAEELSRRAAPAYLGARAKEAAMRKTTALRHRATAIPTLVAVCGAVLGALAARAIERQLRGRSAKRVSRMGERFLSREQPRSFLSAKARGDPLLFGLGALALGAAIGFVLPVSRGERRLLAPAKERAKEQLRSIGEKLEREVGAELPRGQGPEPEGPERPGPGSSQTYH